MGTVWRVPILIYRHHFFVVIIIMMIVPINVSAKLAINLFSCFEATDWKELLKVKFVLRILLQFSLQRTLSQPHPKQSYGKGTAVAVGSLHDGFILPKRFAASQQLVVQFARSVFLQLVVRFETFTTIG